MSINKNVARVLMQHKEEYALSFDDLSRKLGIARSSTVNYCNGAVNLRADTLELLAERCGVAITELVSDPLPGREQAETIILAAKELASLPPGHRERGTQLFLELAALFASVDHG